jgi:hypothetical protein
MDIPTSRDLKRMTKWAVSRLPAAPSCGRSIESAYPELIHDLTREFKLESRIEWESYGQGYASYVDAWFYQDKPEFQLPALTKGEMRFTGPYVLLCRDAPYFVMGEGAKSWTAKGGSSYLPGFSSIDEFSTRAVRDLSEKLSAFLAEHGLVRLRKSDVAEELPEDLHFDTNLADGKHRLYDALFFWYD